MLLKKKKGLCTLILLLLSSGILITGCTQKMDYGAVNKVEIEDEQDTESENVFSPTDDTLGYTYETIEVKSSYIRFKYPKGWDVERNNDKDICFTSPENDAVLPNVTLYFYATSRIFHPQIETVGAYPSIFKTNIYTHKYLINGESASQTRYVTPTKIVTDTSFCNDRKDMLTTAYTDDVKMGTVFGRVNDGNNIGIDYFVKWAGLPVCFSCYTDKSNKKKVEALLKYMVSNITYTSPDLSKTQVINDKNIALVIPKEFENKEDTNGYVCPISSESGLSGMGISIYETKEKLTKEKISDEYAAAMHSDTFVGDENSFFNVYNCQSSEKTKVANMNATKFTTTCSVMHNGTNGDPYYEDGDTYYMTTYFIQSDKENIVINYTWPAASKPVAEKVMYMIEHSAKLV